jgi:hypothetical protein
MVKGTASLSYNTVPIVATGTFCPALTLAAPQTICMGVPVPISTVVNFSLSASGCGIQVGHVPLRLF